MDFNDIRKILLYAVGVTLKPSQQSISWLQVAHLESLGGLLLLLALLSIFSGAYFMSLVSGSPIVSIFIGIIWGLSIFFLNRALTTISEDKEEPIKNTIKNGTRLGLSIALGLVIAKPIELKFAEKGILKILNEDKQNTIAYNLKKLDSLNLQKEALFKRKNEKQDQQLSDAARIRNEKLKKAPSYKDIEKIDEAYEHAVSKPILMDTAHINQYNSEIQRILGENEALKNEVDKTLDDFDVMQKLTAYEKLCSSPQSSAFHWIIKILFVLMDAMPVVLKWMNARNKVLEQL